MKQSSQFLNENNKTDNIFKQTLFTNSCRMTTLHISDKEYYFYSSFNCKKNNSDNS